MEGLTYFVKMTQQHHVCWCLLVPYISPLLYKTSAMSCSLVVN